MDHTQNIICFHVLFEAHHNLVGTGKIQVKLLRHMREILQWHVQRRCEVVRTRVYRGGESLTERACVKGSYRSTKLLRKSGNRADSHECEISLLVSRVRNGGQIQMAP